MRRYLDRKTGEVLSVRALSMRLDSETEAALDLVCGARRPKMTRSALVRELIHRAMDEHLESVRTHAVLANKATIVAARAAKMTKPPPPRQEILCHACFFQDGESIEKGWNDPCPKCGGKNVHVTNMGPG